MRKVKRIRTGRSGPGVSVTTTFTAEAGLLEQIEQDVVRPVRTASGYKCNRSRVLQAMLMIVAEVAPALNVKNIRNHTSLTDELRRAICGRESK